MIKTQKIFFCWGNVRAWGRDLPCGGLRRGDQANCSIKDSISQFFTRFCSLHSNLRFWIKIKTVTPHIIWDSESLSLTPLAIKALRPLFIFSINCKSLESPLDSKENKPVNPKGNQPWIFTGRTDDEAPILWSPDEKSWLNGKDPDAGKDGGHENRTTEDEMAGWHHQLNGHKFEQTPGGNEGQRSLVCCGPWGRKELDTTEWLNNNKTESQNTEYCTWNPASPFSNYPYTLFFYGFQIYSKYLYTNQENKL